MLFRTAIYYSSHHLLAHSSSYNVLFFTQNLFFSQLQDETYPQPQKTSELLVEEIQAFIWQYHLRGCCPVPSATSLFGLPGLRSVRLSCMASSPAPHGTSGFLAAGLNVNWPPQEGNIEDEVRKDVRSKGFEQKSHAIECDSILKQGGPREILGLQQKVVFQLLDR
jgi:hypothetical protein